MITVHHRNNSRSQRVLWLLEELGVAYEVTRYERDAKTMLAPPALLAVHPLGKSPVIVDGTVRVAESGATRTWFAGDEFTAADVQMSFPLEAAASRGGAYSY
jgi:glutathione S-transferase